MSDKHDTETREKTNLRFLEIKIGLSKWILAGVFSAAIGVYISQFGSHKLSLDPEAWGQFGDYVGGLLNPLVAYFAFYWLATSVLLQKTELADTRKALIASQHAQQLQADTALLTVQIQTLNIKLQSVATRLNQTRQQLGELLHFQGVNGPGRSYYDENGDESSPQEAVDKLRKYAIGLTDQENSLIAEIQRLSEQFFVEKRAVS